MADKVSLDEFMEKRRQRVGKTAAGKEAVFKGFAAPASWNPDARSAVFVMSSERIDRDGDVVRQKGIRLDDFEKNPQALLFHSSRDWPIGQWSDVKKKLRSDPKHTEGTLNFAPSGGPIPEIDQAAWAVENGLIRTVSIGFMPLDMEMIEHNDGASPWPWGFDILASDLFEASLVPLPACQDAIAKDMLARGEFQPAKEFIEQAIDEWARDPRTSMFVPKKELSDTYRRFFGKNAVMVMALDSVVPAEKSALRRVEEAITTAAVTAVAQRTDGAGRQKPLVAILWGKDAESVVPLLEGAPSVVSVHPSPLSASRGFFGSKPFSRTNALLVEQGAEPVDWELPVL